MKSISIHPRVRMHGRAGSGVCVVVCLFGGWCLFFGHGGGDGGGGVSSTLTFVSCLFVLE